MLKKGKANKDESKIKKEILGLCSTTVATRQGKSRRNKDHNVASNDEMLAVILEELKSMKVAMGELQQQKDATTGAIVKEHTPIKMLSAPNRSIFNTRESVSKEEARASKAISDRKKRKVERKRTVQGQVQAGKCDVMKRKKEKLPSKHTIFVPQKQHVQHKESNEISLPDHKMGQYGSDIAQATADVRSEEKTYNSIFIQLPSFMTQPMHDSTSFVQQQQQNPVPHQQQQQEDLGFFEDEQKKIRQILMNQYSKVEFDEDPLVQFIDYENEGKSFEYLQFSNISFSPLQSGERQSQDDLPVLDFPLKRQSAAAK